MEINLTQQPVGNVGGHGRIQAPEGPAVRRVADTQTVRQRHASSAGFTRGTGNPTEGRRVDSLGGGRGGASRRPRGRGSLSTVVRDRQTFGTRGPVDDIRPCLDSKPLNAVLRQEHFKMEGLHTVRDIAQQNDLGETADMSKAYHPSHVPLYRPHRRHARFMWKGRRLQFTCLWFGLSSAPRVFTKIIMPVVTHLRSQGLRMAQYLDDSLLLAQGWRQFHPHALFLRQIFKFVGAALEAKKDNLDRASESHSPRWIGTLIELIKMRFLVPREKIKGIRKTAAQVGRRDESLTLTPRQLAGFIGKVVVCQAALPSARYRSRALDHAKTQALRMGSWDRPMTERLPVEARLEREWWEALCSRWNGKAMINADYTRRFCTDASRTGYGAWCLTTGRQIAGFFKRLSKRRSVLTGRQAIQTVLGSDEDGNAEATTETQLVDVGALPAKYSRHDRADVKQSKRGFHHNLDDSELCSRVSGSSGVRRDRQHSGQVSIQQVGKLQPNHTEASGTSDRIPVGHGDDADHGPQSGQEDGRGRRTVQDTSRSNIMETVAHSLQDSRCAVGPTHGGSVRDASKRSGRSLLQLSTRADSAGDGCIVANMEERERLGVSSVHPNRTHSAKGEAGADDDHTMCTNVDVTTMVAGADVNADRRTEGGALGGGNIPATQGCTAANAGDRRLGGRRLSDLRRFFSDEGVPRATSDRLVATLDREVDDKHDRQWSTYADWLESTAGPMGVDIFRPTDDQLVDYFSALADASVTGTAVRGKTVASYRASIAQTLEISSGVEIRGAAMPRASKVLDKISRDKPARARYDDMWDVDKVMDNIVKNYKDNTKLSESKLRKKSVFLLAVTNFMRPSDVAKTGFSKLLIAKDASDFEYRIWDPKEERLRRQREGDAAKWSAPQTCDAYKAQRAIDPVRTIKDYCDRVAHKRESMVDDRLFMSLQKSKQKQEDGSVRSVYTGLKGDTVSNIVQSMLSEAGIDTSIFKGASCRHAGASKAIDGGADYIDVMAKGRWSNYKTFRDFYNRAHRRDTLTTKVLAPVRRKRRTALPGAASG